MIEGRLGISITFAAYFVVLAAIAVAAWRRTLVLGDFILGGRRLGKSVAALSAGASDMSGWLLLGLPGLAYVAGLQSVWLVLGLLIGTYINWRLLAQRLRIYSEMAGNALTVPAFLEQRFADRTHVLRVMSAIFILLFFTVYTTSGLVAGGKLFATAFDIPYAWAVGAGAFAILLYTCVGGFLAVSWTDLIQALLMAAALLAVPVAALAQSGGWGPALEAIRTVNTSLLNPLTDSEGGTISLIAVCSLLGWGLGYFGQPHILARFQAIRSADEVPGARHIAVSWTALTLVGAMLSGLAGVAYLSEPLTGAATETVFMVLVQAMFHPLVAGILLAAILAAIMSTADSQLLVASAVLAEDFYRALLRRKAGDRELMLVGRTAVAVIAVVAWALAMDSRSMVLDLVAYAWAGFGAAFGPVLILALYWRRMNRGGALAGIVVGGTTVIVWKQLSGGLFELYEIIPGVAAAACAVVVGSLVTPTPAENVLARHDTMVDATAERSPHRSL